MGLAEVSAILWRERELLELLLFKLEEEQLILASGRTRWLARATREVELVLDQIRSAEVVRAAEVDAAAADLGLTPGPSLGTLAEACPEPWSALLREHRAAFHQLTAEITALADTNREMLSAGQRAVREAMLAISESSTTYSPTGTPVAAGAPRRLVDQAF
jgi:hypothetical protein